MQAQKKGPFKGPLRFECVVFGVEVVLFHQYDGCNNGTHKKKYNFLTQGSKRSERNAAGSDNQNPAPPQRSPHCPTKMDLGAWRGIENLASDSSHVFAILHARQN